MNNSLIATQGSQLHAARSAGITLAESFLNAELIILMDCSGSMDMNDAPGGLTRRKFAEQQLQRIQLTHPGKVALICFASRVAYSPGGGLVDVGNSTALHKALDFAKVADGCGLKILVVSDGDPDDRDAALCTARTYTSKIDVLYCGPESDYHGGRQFLQQLARATGGQFFTSAKPAELTATVIKLLEG